MNLLYKKSLVILFMALLTACAALQIDVDGYKGPLSDQRDVQHEQLISLVVTSNKLLEDLQRQLLNGLNFNDENYLYIVNKDIKNADESKDGIAHGKLKQKHCHLLAENILYINSEKITYNMFG